jgi:hypothetical protein
MSSNGKVSIFGILAEIQQGDFKFHDITLQENSIYLIGISEKDGEDAIFKFPYRFEVSSFLQRFFNIPISDKRKCA